MRHLPYLLISGLILISSFDFARADMDAVQDRAHLLSDGLRTATQTVVGEHQRLTQDTVFVVTLPDTPVGGLDSEVSRLLDEWKGDTPNPPNTVVIAIDAKRGRLAVRAGIGLDSAFSAGTDRVKEIRRNFFDPEWRRGRPDRALVLSVVEVLRTLESPLIESGFVTQIYEGAGFSGGWTAAPATPRASTTWMGMVLGIAFFAFALYRTLAVEVHTTGEGWRRVPVSEVLSRRFKREADRPLVTGGGVSGGY
jgi:uncharacterized membrane protein YgcG